MSIIYLIYQLMNIISYVYNNGVPNMPMILLGHVQGPWTSPPKGLPVGTRLATKTEEKAHVFDPLTSKTHKKVL